MKKSLMLPMVAAAILCGCIGTSPIPSQTPPTYWAAKRTTNDLTQISSAVPGVGMDTSPALTQTPTDGAAKRITDDVAAIRKLFAENAAALSAGDVSALAKLYEQDAIQLPPNSPALTGWEAIGSTLERELEGIQVAATIEVVEVWTAESWAYARGTYRMVTTPQGGGDRQVTSGNWLDILRRQPDSSWKISRSTWSSEE